MRNIQFPTPTETILAKDLELWDFLVFKKKGKPTAIIVQEVEHSLGNVHVEASGSYKPFSEDDKILVWRGARDFMNWAEAQSRNNAEDDPTISLFPTKDGKTIVRYDFPDTAGEAIVRSFFHLKNVRIEEDSEVQILEEIKLSNSYLIAYVWITSTHPKYPEDGDGNPVPYPILEEGDPITVEFVELLLQGLKPAFPHTTVTEIDGFPHITSVTAAKTEEGHKEKVRLFAEVCSKLPITIYFDPEEPDLENPGIIKGFLSIAKQNWGKESKSGKTNEEELEAAVFAAMMANWHQHLDPENVELKEVLEISKNPNPTPEELTAAEEKVERFYKNLGIEPEEFEEILNTVKNSK